MKSVRNNPSKRHADKDGFSVQLQDFFGKLSRSQLSHTMGNIGFSWFWINYPALFLAIPYDFLPPILYFAKEMRANFAEIRRNSRISANKLRNFVSDENSAKFRRIYFSSPCEISEARWWTETKVRGMNRNFVAKFRESSAKFRVSNEISVRVKRYFG